MTDTEEILKISSEFPANHIAIRNCLMLWRRT